MICPICSISLDNPEKICENGIFEGWLIERYKCNNCDVIFGPLSMINLSLDKLSEMYKNLYSKYVEGDTTNAEIITFMAIEPDKKLRYLNYGAGKWSRSIQILRDRGFDIVGYEPFCSLENPYITNVIDGKFDGIMSHNVIEHFQDPIKSILEMKDMLNLGGIMIHSTDCYEYVYVTSEYHLFYLMGRSIDVICEKTNLKLIKRPGKNLILKMI
jgi:SAM-dependent methyltransferase